jgi:trimeric autotransporter adhesin
VSALYNNSIGSENTAEGYGALYSNTSGLNNTAAGFQALYSNTTGGSNTAAGLNALFFNSTGSNNIALGFGAGASLTTGSNNIDIGNAGVGGESNTIRIGTSGTQTATYIAGIRGVAIAGPQPVGINADGQLGVRASSAKFKEEIETMGNASEEILALRPVTFRYKKELDPKRAPQFGLVAEEVARVAPDLVTTDAESKPFTVRYEEVNAMLLNEFLKEHRRVESLEKAIIEQRNDLEASITNQQKEINALRDRLQNVNHRLERRGATARLIANY